MTYLYGYLLTDTDPFNNDARGLFPDADDEGSVEEATLYAANVTNIDALVDLMD